MGNDFVSTSNVKKNTLKIPLHFVNATQSGKIIILFWLLHIEKSLDCESPTSLEFITGLLTTNCRAGSHGQDHFLTSLLMHLHYNHNMLTDNKSVLTLRWFAHLSQSSLALCLWLSLCYKFCACALADFSEYCIE